MGANKLELRFVSQPQLNNDIIVTVNDGVNNIPLTLTAKSQRLAYGQYEVTGVAQQPVTSFANAWNIDHRNVGGAGNIIATLNFAQGYDGVIMVLDNPSWQWVSATGLSLQAGEVVVEYLINGTPPAAEYYDHALTGADCTDADYSIDIFGGTAPYTISGLPYGTLTGVAAVSAFTLQRGTPASVRVVDSLGALIQEKSITPPKNLKVGNFTITVTPYAGGNTATVAPNIVISSNILPIEYSLDGISYSSTGSFSGLGFEETFTMYIRDAFGCVLQKTFVTLEDLGTTTEQEYFRNFKISNAGTLSFSKLEEYTTAIKKNPHNSLSYEELSGIPYGYVHEFDGSDTIVQQFKSSYGYHKITLLENGNATFIQPILQNENLNQVEKVDAKLFRTVTGVMGMYFANGDTYIPNTTTSNGTSVYDASNLPSWGVVGQVVVIDGIGEKTITRVTTDSSRGLYLEFADNYTSTVDVDVLVQANYNRQDYNLYEFALPMSQITNTARVIIEAGFNDLVEITHVSECIKKINDDNARVLIEWSDPENKAGIVHQTGIKNFARMYAKLTHRTVSESELYNGSNEPFNLNQEAYTVADIELVVKGFKMENKLVLASGMEDFYINNVNYKKESWASEVQGNTNVYEIKGLLRFGANELESNVDEIVLNPPSTPLTDKPVAPATIPNILNVGSDVFVLNGDGGFILVDNG